MNWEQKQLSREIGNGAASIAGALAGRHGLDSDSKRQTADFLAQKLAELSGLDVPVRVPDRAPSRPVVIEGSVAEAHWGTSPRIEVEPALKAAVRPEPVTAVVSAVAVPAVAPSRSVRPERPAPALRAPAVRPAKKPPVERSPAKKVKGRLQARKAERKEARAAGRVGRSVFLRRIVSLEDGQSYPDLRPHLKAIGLSPDDYRRKHSLPAHYPMVAPAVFLKAAEYAVVETF